MGITRNDVFPSKYISSADIEGRELALTIKDILMEEMVEGERKAVIYFDKGKKGMVVNVTNWNVLEAAYGPDTDDWIEKPVILCVEQTTFKGKPTKGLRVHVPPQKTRPGMRTKQPSENPAEDMGDDIPF